MNSLFTPCVENGCCRFPSVGCVSSEEDVSSKGSLQCGELKIFQCLCSVKPCFRREKSSLNLAA